MRVIFVTLLFVGMTCNGQVPDTLIYIDRAEHESAMAKKDATIDSLLAILKTCQELQDTDDMSVVADTFRFQLVDNRVRVEVIKQGHNVWYNFEDGAKRINADYRNYERQVMLMDSTYTVGSLYIR